MARLELLRLIVRSAGVVIAIQSLIASVLWFSNHLITNTSWPVSTAAMLPIFWFATGLLLITNPIGIIGLLRRRSSEKGHDSFFQIKTVDYIVVRLLGLYLLAQAACDVSDIIPYQLEHLRIGALRFWFEKPTTHFVGIHGALTKTIFGLWLLIDTRNVQRILRWARTAGRTWKLD
jgi:hypothetical protein